tara:strand:- start:388 stop:603 length:216 start_codon:yes stop_codon:yes gene_type:complete
MMSDNVISINGIKHDTESMTDQQKYLVNQIRDLQTRAGALRFQLDQVQVAQDAFTKALIESVEAVDEAAEN